MNAQKLAILARDNRAAQVFFAAYSTRRRALHETPLQEVMTLARHANIGLSPTDVTAFFHGLEDAQCGQILENALSTRFEWLVKSTQAAKLALKTPVEAASSADAGAAPRAVVHTLQLRADWTVSLELPPDFTPEEAKRMCHFVRALPLSPPRPPQDA